MRVLALSSQKGGSGKTTLSGHLAVQAQRVGDGPVCLIDIDPQGSLADWWNEREDEMPAFAQTTVARLGADLEVLRQQGFRLAVIDTPPAITMAIQSVIQVAELIVIPTRPSPHDLRAVGATVDLCERAGKPLIFVVNGATPKAKITYEAAVALSQHGTVAPVTLHHRTDFAASMIDGRTVMEVDPNRPVGPRGRRAVGLYRRPARKEFPPHRLLRARRPGAAEPASSVPRPASAGAWSASEGGRDDERRTQPFASLSSGLLARKGAAKPAMRPQGFGHHAGFEDLGWNDMGHEPAAEDGVEGDLPEHVPSSIAALTPAPKHRQAVPSEPRRRRAARRARGGRAAARHRRELPAPRSRPRPSRGGRRRGAGRGRAAAASAPGASRPSRSGPQGRLHAAARRRAPSAPAARHRGHRPLGAADRDRRARRVARVHSRSRSAGRAGSRPPRRSGAEPRKGQRHEQDRLQDRRLDRRSSR